MLNLIIAKLKLLILALVPMWIAYAQFEPLNVAYARSQQTVRKGTPRGKSKPGGTYPASCKTVPIDLVALIENQDADFTASDVAGFGLWFYIPYEKRDIGSIEVSLTDEKNTWRLINPILLTVERPGVIYVDLSDVKSKLELDKNYRWMLKFYCEDKVRGANKTLHGWIQKRAKTTSEEFAYDRINRIVKSHFDDLNDSQASADWNQLLKSLNVSELNNMQLAK
jgi:hypothetical protein